ncbi:MAG: cytochrome c oxidase subunit II [Ilumatobacteraceae bacterium]
MSDVDEQQPIPRHRSRAWLTGAGVVALGALLAGCAKNAPQDTWQPAGENARKIDDLQRPVFAIAGVVLVLVCGVVGFCIVKFRDRGQDMPEQSHGKPALEIALTIIPAVILLITGVFTVKTVFALAKTSDTQCIINVTGQQWWWEYDYPVQSGCMDGGITAPIVTSGELVIPANEHVLLHITSRDVIHSFWIPRLNGKRDAVPGRDQTLRMEADQPGIYDGQCTEFCGLSHARMRMAAVSLNSADFATWVGNQLEAYTPPEAGTLAATGESTFISQCSRCHQVNGLTTTVNGVQTPVLSNPDEYLVSGSAPNLTNLMTRTTFAGATFDLLTADCKKKLYDASPDEFGQLYLQGVTPDCFDEAKLRSWIRDAPAMKPMYSGEDQLTDGKYRGMPHLTLTENQIDELVAYLQQRK